MEPTTTAAKSVLPTDINAPRFRIVTKALGAEQSADGRRRFRATASSTITDRAGDEISLKALGQMAAKFREGVTIFTDHENVVANAYGMTDTAEIVQRGQDPKTGAAIWDLDIGGVVNDPNPKAKQLHDSIEGGFVKLGCSIDAFVLEHERKKSGGLAIEGIDVFAASIVGVPMNQRSWTQKAVRAVKSFYGQPDEEDDVVTKGNPFEASEAVVEPLEGTAEEPVAEEATEEPVVTKAAVCVKCGGESAIDGCDHDFHKPSAEKSVDDDTALEGIDLDKSAEADTSEAITKSATEGGQEADPAATPETAPDVEIEETDSASVQKALAFETTDVVELVKHVGVLVKAVAERDAKIEELRTERDRLATENEDARAVIEKVMSLPLRPKTVGFVADLTKRYPDYLAPDVVALLNRKNAGEPA